MKELHMTTYTINLASSAASATGTIVTDGSTGVLSSSNIIDWNLVISVPGYAPIDLTGPSSGNDSEIFVGGNDLTASATGLFFNFQDQAAGSGFGFGIPSGPDASATLLFANMAGNPNPAAGGQGGAINIDDLTPFWAIIPAPTTDLIGETEFQQTTDATGSGPFSVAVGDVNGDGKLDIVTANANANTVSVLLGNGDGTFQPQATYGTGPGPLSVAIGDLNGDGKPDLVVANGNSFSTDSVLLGNGDGTFQPQTTVVVGESHQVVIGDLNGDGKLDLVNANSNSGTVSVSLGNGDGTFQSRTTYAVEPGFGGSGPISVAIGDVNGDGKPDLVTADYSENAVSVLLGNGDGTFLASTSYAAGSQPGLVQVADLNGDGRQDIVVANQTSNNVSVLLGNGDGTFQPETTYSVGAGQGFIRVADVNGDGKPDIVALDNGGASVLLGNGDGTFQPATFYATGSGPSSVAIGDLNGDGKPDIITSNSSDNNVSVLLNNDESAEPPPTLTTPTITGTAQEGQTLMASATVGSDEAGTASFQWQSSADGVTFSNISGATAATYILGETDENKFVQVVTSFTEDTGQTVTKTSAPTAKVLDAMPTLTVGLGGVAEQGATLTAQPTVTSDDGGSLSYQWQSSPDAPGWVGNSATWTNISGATASTYTTQEGDENNHIQVVVTFTDDTGQTVTASQFTGAAVYDPAPTLTIPTIGGTAQEGQTLTASATVGSDEAGTASFQWQSSADGVSFSNISGATAATYKLGETDENKYFRVVASFTDDTGQSVSHTSVASSKVVDAAPTLSSPVISGTAKEGQTLTASAALPNDTDATVTYQWQVLNGRNWAPISGATASTYQVTEANEGHQLRVVATSSDVADGSGTTATSAPTAAVTDIAPTLSTPVISGTAKEGQTLTASAALPNDTDATVTYQWQANHGSGFVNLSGQTSLSHVVTEADEGATLRIVATSSDLDGSGISATSAATAAVIDIVPTLTVSGGSGGREPKNTTLTANLTNTESGATITYQWQSSTNNTTWTNIAGATSSTYKVAPALNNDFFRVVVTYTDDEAKQTLTSSDAAEPPFLTVKNATASETATSIPLSITDTAVDSDDTLLPVTISGVPTSWTLSDSVSAPTNLGNGTWSVEPDALASLVILPPTGGFNQGTVKLTVTASNLDTDGTETETLSTSSSLAVTIHPGSTPIGAMPQDGTQTANLALFNQFLAAGFHEQDGIPIVASSRTEINSNAETFLTPPHH
jgi:FG-GAP-like repeat